jgi:hypothetical protein
MSLNERKVTTLFEKHQLNESVPAVLEAIEVNPYGPVEISNLKPDSNH